MTSTRITVALPGYRPAKWRPAFVRALSWKLQPESVIAAWYASDCNPALDLSVRDRIVWRFACWLRGCRA